ncbi:MAG TPA: NAD(P)H-dependent glycerol-3-phosphate dehydrogenase [Bryobacteraceae bacterium]|jgi:glycerol-3-phosphate dehydrogenase (NAD(P)+)|nr:NAD(P)H-dependent glycerol-3-phosphate dehydrogenase [Bryobacteraceae bacterium]
MTRLAIIGGGGWGTALACVLAPRFDRVSLWVYEEDLALRIESSRINDVFLPGVTIPGNVRAVHSLESALAGADVVLTAVPSHALRTVCGQMAQWLNPSMRIVSATKGLESGTLLRMSQVIGELTGSEYGIAVLSGPTFAPEVAAGQPTAVVIASENAALVTELQTAFSGPTFRAYGSHDPIGVEIGGALKNVIAIGAGISDGLGLGHNAVAALITRGLAELTRLAAALGARAQTLSGLAGLGDLVLTCTGDLSRNRQVGLKLAAGLDLDRILDATPMVAEGVRTTAVALQLAALHGVDLPIAAEMNAVLEGGRSPGEAIKRLMGRALRNEGSPVLR